MSPHRCDRTLILFLPVTLLMGAASEHPQGKFPPESLRNVQVMPEGTTVKQLVETMRGFTRALGVRCTHCHGYRGSAARGEWTSRRTRRPPRRPRGR